MNASTIPIETLSRIRLTLENGTYLFESPDGHTKGTLAVDFSKTPSSMDVTEKEEPNVGRINHNRP